MGAGFDRLTINTDPRGEARGRGGTAVGATGSLGHERHGAFSCGDVIHAEKDVQLPVEEDAQRLPEVGTGQVGGVPLGVAVGDLDRLQSQLGLRRAERFSRPEESASADFLQAKGGAAEEQGFGQQRVRGRVLRRQTVEAMHEFFRQGFDERAHQLMEWD